MPEDQELEPVQRGAGEVVRQEMGAACLLADGEGHSQGEGTRQQGTREPRASVEDHEIESHQREAHRGMRTREAGRRREAVRTVLEQPQKWIGSPEAGDVARAVHLGHLLKHGDDHGQQDHRRHEKACLAAIRTQARRKAAANRDAEARKPDGEDQSRAAAVQEAHGPPGAGADPRLGGFVEEPGGGDAAVEVECTDCGRASDAQGGRQPQMQQPERSRAPGAGRRAAGAHRQKLRLV